MGTKYLNEKEKRLGRRHMYWSEVFNGIAYSFVGDTIVYLMAIYFGAGNIALGYISSALYIAGIVLPIVPRMFRGKNVGKTQTVLWIMRSVVCLGYLLLFFIQGDWAIVIMLAVYTAFCMVRMMGVTVNSLTMKTISSSANRGSVIAQANIAYQGASTVGKIAASIVTTAKIFGELITLIVLQLLGAFANIFAAAHVKKIPSKITVEHQPGQSVFATFKEAMKPGDTRPRLILRWIYITITIIMAMTVPFMNKGLGLNSTMVIMYSVISGAAIVIAGIFTKKFADRLGSRPLIVWGAIALTFIIAAWIVMPVAAGVPVFFALGFLYNFVLGMINLLVVRLVTASIPEKGGIGFNSMVDFVIAILATVTGVLSGILVNIGESLDGLLRFGTMTLGNSYSIMFILAFILSVAGWIISNRMKERGSLSTQDAASVLFSAHGLQAFFMIDRLNKTDDPVKRKALLLAVGTNLTGVATSEIRTKLASPFSSDTQEYVRALGDRPRAALADDLIRLAKDNDSYVQLDAIAALGSYRKNEKAKAALVELLDGKWSSVRSVASKSLARMIEGPEYLAQVNELSLKARHIDEEIDFLIAKRFMDKEGVFYRDFFISVKQGRSVSFRQTRYALLASFVRFGFFKLSRLFELMNNGTVKDFLSDFLTEARDVEEIDANYDAIFAAFANEDWRVVRDIYLAMVSTADVAYDTRMEHLKQGILAAAEMDSSLFDVNDHLAALYFSYSLKRTWTN